MQVLDVAFYETPAARDAAVARLPQLAIAPRHDHEVPPHCVVLDLELSHISSTVARSGRVDLVLPEARPFL
jgi:hypothetical protein